VTVYNMVMITRHTVSAILLVSLSFTIKCEKSTIESRSSPVLSIAVPGQNSSANATVPVAQKRVHEVTDYTGVYEYYDDDPQAFNAFIPDSKGLQSLLRIFFCSQCHPF